MRNWKALVLVLLAALASGLRSRAEPPAGVNPDCPLAQWFAALRQPPKYEASCCSIADCRRTTARLKLDGAGRPMYDSEGREMWEAIYPQTLDPDPDLTRHWWVDVPPEIVIPDERLPEVGPNKVPYNLAEEAVLCADLHAQWYTAPRMYCFVRPPPKT